MKNRTASATVAAAIVLTLSSCAPAYAEPTPARLAAVNKITEECRKVGYIVGMAFTDFQDGIPMSTVLENRPDVAIKAGNTIAQQWIRDIYAKPDVSASFDPIYVGSAAASDCMRAFLATT